MREISLHLIDIIENSVSAKASLIEIEINENKNNNILGVSVTDNGCGISSDMLNRVTDPFVTSRTSRKVGLGLSLFKAACERCDGSFIIESLQGKGTAVKALMKYDHIDRAPLGKLEDTIITALVNPGIDILYTHRVNENTFIMDSREIRKITGEDLANPEILVWIKEYLRENIDSIGGGVY